MDATNINTSMDAQQEAAIFQDHARQLRDTLHSQIVGHARVVEGVLLSLLAGGHCLLEGVPGLGKTLLVRTLATAIDAKYSRIQFTPDLMPADILGTHLVVEDAKRQTKRFEFQPGPIFGNIILADEINRATPKTQSALLEAMEEKQVTLGTISHAMSKPFFVIATQNPIEMEGTYPLPEAQLDRFTFKLLVESSPMGDLVDILDRTTGTATSPPVCSISGSNIQTMQKTARSVPVNQQVKEYAARLLLATAPDSEQAAPIAKQYLKYGASPRGAQAMILTAKALALIAGRYNVSHEDVRHVAKDALRHRIILNFEAEAEGISPDQILDDILSDIPMRR